MKIEFRRFNLFHFNEPRGRMDDNVRKVKLAVEWKKIKPLLEDAAGDNVLSSMVVNFCNQLVPNHPNTRHDHQMEDSARFVETILRTPNGAYATAFRGDPCADSIFNSPSGQSGVWVNISDYLFEMLEKIKDRLRLMDLLPPLEVPQKRAPLIDNLIVPLGGEDSKEAPPRYDE